MPAPTTLPFNPGRLQDLRERKGLSRLALNARLADLNHPVHFTYLSKIERGLHKPSPKLLLALTQALDVSIDDLLDPPTANA